MRFKISVAVISPRLYLLEKQLYAAETMLVRSYSPFLQENGSRLYFSVIPESFVTVFRDIAISISVGGSGSPEMFYHLWSKMVY